MKLSELIEEFIDLKIEGAPDGSGWISIDENARRYAAYIDRLAEFRSQIDEAAHGIKGESDV